MTNARSTLQEIIAQSRALEEAVASGGLSLIVPSAITGDSPIEELQPDHRAVDYYVIQTPAEPDSRLEH
jgi:hypothetical protein